MKRIRCIAVVLSALALGACSGLGEGGRLVKLYDMMEPSGTIELELERDGTLIEMEADVPVDLLPGAVRMAALERLPGAEITGAELEYQGSREVWEVKLRHEDRDWEFIVDAGGKIIESEKELSQDEAPAAVLTAAEAAIPGSTFKSVERIELPDRILYHVKRTRDGASYKIILDPHGVVTRKVREARAEIEIPLED